jgi:hypothetical protein
LDGQFAHALQDGGYLVAGAFRDVQQGDAVAGVADGHVGAAHLGADFFRYG